VTLDKNLSMDHLANSVSKSIHYHIRALWHICPSISEYMAKMVACTLFGSHLDYANSDLLIYVTKTSLNFKEHNLLARVVTGSFQSSSYNVFHWLPTEHRIHFKIANINFPHSPFLSTCLSAFSLACSSFHSFSWVVKYQFVLHPICPRFVRHS